MKRRPLSWDDASIPRSHQVGAQLSITFPLFAHWGVPLWVPEVGRWMGVASDPEIPAPRGDTHPDRYVRALAQHITHRPSSHPIAEFREYYRIEAKRLIQQGLPCCSPHRAALLTVLLTSPCCSPHRAAHLTVLLTSPVPEISSYKPKKADHRLP
jgi:hypothetical protein